MITKVTLNDVACYKIPATLETDKRINLIYGLNGTGKSTFTRYLANLDGAQYSKCDLLLSPEDTDVDFLVYDEDYIEANFYQSDTQKGIFSLSKENKDAKQKIDNANREIGRLSMLISECKTRKDKITGELSEVKDNAAKTVWEIKKKYYGGDRVLEEFLKGHMASSLGLLEYLWSIQLPVEEPKMTIDQIKDQLQKLNDANGLPLDSIPILKLDIDDIIGNEIWNKVIVGNENSTVSALINKLGNSDWVKHGLNYLPEGDVAHNLECPFCQQLTISSKLISELRGYFDENYERDLQTLSKLKTLYVSIINSIQSISAFKENPHISHLSVEYEAKLLALQDVLTTNAELMQKKIDNPSLCVDFHSHVNALVGVNSVIKKANEIIYKFNHKLENINTEKGKLRREFWNINRIFYNQTIKAIDEKALLKQQICYVEDQNISKYDNQIIEQKKIIQEEQKKVVNIQIAIDHINETLVDIGVDDIIIESAGDNNYRIKRRGEQSTLFRSFSEGERMLISFLYFMERTKGKDSPEASDRKIIVVVDDPISSLSHVHVFNIGRLIKRHLFDNASIEQIFVLTHSLYFFYELTDTNHERRENSQALHRFYKNSDGTHIVKMKYEEMQNDYHAYWSIVNDKDQSPALIANCMRNIIDYFFGFVEKLEYNNLFSRAGISNKLRFQAFNRYMNRESHSIGQNIFDIKEFDYDSFREALKLLFINNGYEKHYNKMTKIGGS